MYDANLIARYVIHRCAETEKALSPQKLQDILYFVQADFLACENRPCFPDPIEAGVHGAVVRNVCDIYRVYGSTSIPDQGTDGLSDLSSGDEARLNAMTDDAARYSARTLSEIIRRQRPWKEGRARADHTIQRETLGAYFAE